MLALVAALLHWMIYPITQGRITFIFFIPATVLATTRALWATVRGRGTTPGGT